MQRFWLWMLLVGGLTVGPVRPAVAQSLFDLKLFEATPTEVRARLEQGAAINARNQVGGTPLHSAATNENPAVVALLLDRRADATLRDIQNRLPVDRAAENEHLQGTAVYWWLNEARF